MTTILKKYGVIRNCIWNLYLNTKESSRRTSACILKCLIHFSFTTHSGTDGAELFFASKGVHVIPTVSWADEKSFEFCFKGIEKGSIVAVSTYMFHESDHHKDQKELFMNGYNRMLSEIEPEKIICYSEPFYEMKGDIIYVDYEFKFMEIS